MVSLEDIFNKLESSDAISPTGEARQVIRLLLREYKSAFPLNTPTHFFNDIFIPLVIARLNGLDSLDPTFDRLMKACKDNELGCKDAIAGMSITFISTSCVLAIFRELEGKSNLAWKDMFDANFHVSLLMSKSVMRESNMAALSKQGKLGAQGRSNIYQPLREYARQLATARKFPSKRNAAITIAPDVIAKAKELNIPFSENQAEISIAKWIADLFAGKYTT